VAKLPGQIYRSVERVVEGACGFNLFSSAGLSGPGLLVLMDGLGEVAEVRLEDDAQPRIRLAGGEEGFEVVEGLVGDGCHGVLSSGFLDS